jgi:hypothetical protein
VDVEAFAGRVDGKKLLRQSYMNGLLIQSRGRPDDTYVQCRKNPNHSPFIDCRQAPGHFASACSNCKWHDKGTSYRFLESDEENSSDESEELEASVKEESDDEEEGPQMSQENALGEVVDLLESSDDEE